MTAPPSPSGHDPADALLDRVRCSPGVTDMATAARPDESGAADRTTATDPPQHVWYVSYGSNLLRERFERYLLGGRLPGLDVVYPAGPDVAPASADRAVVLPGRLRFALDAPSWGGGGVAFWDPAGDGPGVLARAWRVRLEQFLEVVHLENGGRERSAAPWPSEVLVSGDALVGDGWYSRLLRPGRLDGEPLLTFTHPRPGSLSSRSPSSAYRSVVARGVVETFGDADRGGLGPADAQRYLAAALSRS